jgi:uncharacterized protein (TIGR04255 family)
MNEKNTDLFPSSRREVYKQTPLAQVICQFRFPRLLTIETSPPVKFQEAVRDVFPFLEPVNSQLPADMPPEIRQALGIQAVNEYRFLTETRSYSLALSPEALSLSTGQYTTWGDFRTFLAGPLQSLIGIYRPSFFSRIGLRYQNIIDRKKLGLTDKPWSNLLRHELLGELAIPEFEQRVENVANRTLKLKLANDAGSVVMKHGFARIANQPEQAYAIDFDFSLERKIEVSDAEPTFNHFNELAGNAFRWAISSTLREALGPMDAKDVAA